MRRLLAMLYIVTALFLVVAPATASEKKTETTVRVDYTSEFQVWVLQIMNNRYVWDAIASTEGWGEIDFGLNFNLGSWSIQPIIGVDFAPDDTGQAEFGSFIPQLYVLKFEPFHAETWLNAFVPFENASATTYVLRQILTWPLSESGISLGGQFDAKGDGDTNRTFAGPLLEYGFLENAVASFTFQFDTSDTSNAQFLLTVLAIY